LEFFDQKSRDFSRYVLFAEDFFAVGRALLPVEPWTRNPPPPRVLTKEFDGQKYPSYEGNFQNTNRPPYIRGKLGVQWFGDMICYSPEAARFYPTGSLAIIFI
jgi:hypothetical protein